MNEASVQTAMFCASNVTEYRLEKNRGLILTSPNFPSLPTNPINCTQTFTFPSDSSLLVYLVAVHLPTPTE